MVSLIFLTFAKISLNIHLYFVAVYSRRVTNHQRTNVVQEDTIRNDQDNYFLTLRSPYLFYSADSFEMVPVGRSVPEADISSIHFRWANE